MHKMQECSLEDLNSCKDLSLNEAGCYNNQVLGPTEEEGSHRTSTGIEVEVEVVDVVVGVGLGLGVGGKVEAVVIGLGIEDGGKVEAGLGLGLVVAGVGA